MLHDARLVLSNIAIYQSDPTSAETWLEQVWDEYPGDPGVLNDLGYTWADQGTHLQRRLADDPPGRRGRAQEPGLSR